MPDDVPTNLSVNLNAIAMLRNRRDLPWPSLTGFGRQALEAGAHGLTVHPRPDQRHIRFSDLPEIRALIDDGFPQAEFNIEGYPTEAFLQLAEASEPDQVTLVPDDPAQATSDHGWDFRKDGATAETHRVARLRRNRAFVCRSLPMATATCQRPCHLAAETGRRPGRALYRSLTVQCHDDPAAAGGRRDRSPRTQPVMPPWSPTGSSLNAGHDLTVANLPALLAQRIPQSAGGLHRPRADRRRAAIWHDGCRAAVSGRMRPQGLTLNGLLSEVQT